MKYILLILLAFISFSSSFSQERSDTIDIKKMVAEQINKAQTNHKEIQVPEKSIEQEPLFKDANEGFNYNVNGIKLAAGLLILTWISYTWLKGKKGKKPSNNIHSEVNNVQIIRSKLMDSLKSEMGEADISKAAKELNIGKGEFYLAALLKAKELNKLAGSR